MKKAFGNAIMEKVALNQALAEREKMPPAETMQPVGSHLVSLHYMDSLLSVNQVFANVGVGKRLSFHKEMKERAARALRGSLHFSVRGPVSIKYTFHVNEPNRDWDNCMIKYAQDYMVKAGILEGDSCKTIRSGTIAIEPNTREDGREWVLIQIYRAAPWPEDEASK